MTVSFYVKELKESVSNDKIRSTLLELGDLPVSTLDCSDLEEALLNLSKHPDLLISLKALQILTRIYRHRHTASREYYAILTKTIEEHPSGKKTEQVLIFLQRLSSLEYKKHRLDIELFKEDPIREEIVAQEELMLAIFNVCHQKQCKYQALLLLWILSFSQKAMAMLESLPMFMLTFVSKDCKEKELRTSLSIIKNFLMHATKHSFSLFQKIEEVLSLVSSKGNKDDPEEQEDLKFCRERYALLSRRVSTFEAYLEELRSGHLQPAPYHFSEEFWRSNLDNIAHSRSEMVRLLKRYLKSKDSDNIWLASNDIYRMVEVYPESIAIIRQMDVHQALFDVLSSKHSEDVRFHAMEALSVCYTRE
ncbi:V-type H+-transporting ATPase subunit H [Nematocida displodere]|uniref:V-type H+-transporting ATPase subunit H n=1 Tax=Nematocida displodere TaxID=1805483 RepID=A0A177EGC4_9MICR|nr:V-type H+-transporting ATPase subunit H [Nematocida displodere]